MSNTRARAAFALALSVTVALSFQSEDSSSAFDNLDAGDLGQTAGELRPKAAPKKIKIPMTYSDRLGLRVLDEYAKTNKNLQRTEAHLRAKLSNPPEQVEGISYNAIPGYKYSFQSRKMQGKSRPACELVCNTYSACKSYSYNRKTRTCIWSMSSLKYDPEFRMYAKKQSPQGKPEELYAELPGMLIQDRIKKTVKDLSFAECKYACTKDESCATFSYSVSKMECVQSGVPLHYTEDFTYYEKNAPVGSVKWKKDSAKEKKRKDILKEKFVKSSTATSRARMEKNTKKVTQLTAARKAAVSSEQIEKKSRKTYTASSKQCALARATAMASLQRNMKLLSQVSKKNLVLVKRKATAEKFTKIVKTKKHFEAASKAKLQASLAIEKSKEANKKHTSYVKAEKGEKGRRKKAEERRSKACDAKSTTKIIFKTKEGVMKKLAAKASEAKKAKLLAFASVKYQKVKVSTGKAEEAERVSKRKAAVRQEQYEAAIKKEKATTTELSRKRAIDAKKVAKAALKKAKRAAASTQKTAMVAKEKRSKVRAKLVRDKEKEAKATKVLAQRRKEITTKAEIAAARKRTHKQKEKSSKAEKVAKAKKKKEVFTKKTTEGKSKSEVGFKKVQRDAAQRKYDLRLKAQRYKDLVKKRAADKAAEQSRRQRITKLSKKEKAVKSRQRQDRMKMSNMRSEEHATKRAQRSAISRQRHATATAAHKERSVKSASAHLKRASSEGGTKHRMRVERHAKSQRALSIERQRKSEHAVNHRQQKQVHAGQKVADQKCIMICLEGRKQADTAVQQRVSSELKAKSIKKAAQKKGNHEENQNVFMMLDDELGEGQDARPTMTKAQKELHLKARAQKAKSDELARKAKLVPAKLKIPQHKAFAYKGCQC